MELKNPNTLRDKQRYAVLRAAYQLRFPSQTSLSDEMARVLIDAMRRAYETDKRRAEVALEDYIDFRVAQYHRASDPKAESMWTHNRTAGTLDIIDGPIFSVHAKRFKWFVEDAAPVVEAKQPPVTLQQSIEQHTDSDIIKAVKSSKGNYSQELLERRLAALQRMESLHEQLTRRDPNNSNVTL